MEKEFIPYEQALALKELGFDEPCFTLMQINGIQRVAVNNDYSNKKNNIGDKQIYFNNIQGPGSELFTTIPLYQQAFRWFREKYNLCFLLESVGGKSGYFFAIQDIQSGDKVLDWTDDYYSHEEVELACLKKLIEIVKNNEF